MAEQNIAELREQLIERKEKLNISIKQSGDNENLVNLLEQVDAALERMDNGTYGICVVCKGHIEPERLRVDPLVTVCLEDLSSEEQRVLQQDLNLAAKIQHGLLPKNDLVSAGWITSYSYIPAGPVSGDYVDIIEFKDSKESLLFLLGDVSGKGVAASLLMSHMRAMFHSLVSIDFKINSLVEKANRLFCESSILSHFATLVCGKVNSIGEIEICNAGHNPPLLVKNNKVIKIDSTGVPIGLFCNAKYESKCLTVDKNDILFLYSDGLTESTTNEIEYGEERLIKTVSSLKDSSPKELIAGVLEDLNLFLSGNQRKDDITMMALKRDN